MNKRTFLENVIIITGASSGIGRHLALRLAEQGACLALGARNVEHLEEVSQQLTSEDRENISNLEEEFSSAKIFEIDEVNRIVQALSKTNHILLNPRLQSEISITKRVRNRSKSKESF